MYSDLIIDINKEVTIRKISQWQTYSGLLEGFPTIELNARILSDAKEYARNYCGLEEIYLIEPQQKIIEYEGKYPFGTPSALPGITCIALLRYYKAVRDEKMDFSCLGIIWFQEDYAFPIDQNILDKIKIIPFTSIAGEFSY